MTFDGKSKSTSQFYYNLSQDSTQELLKKIEVVIDEYFSWYTTFQNKDPIKYVDMTSCDFLCSTGCRLNITHKLNIIGLIVTKKELLQLLKEQAEKYQLQLDLKL